MTAPGDQLGPVPRCPLATRCEACGGGRALDVATYQTPVGVFCATVCGACVAAGNPPPIRSWGQACERVGAHCHHLGIDLTRWPRCCKPNARRDAGDRLHRRPGGAGRRS